MHALMGPIEVSWLLPDGRGGGTAPDGRTVRVEGALPGDEVTVEVTGERGRTVDGVAASFVRRGTERREPPCPHTAACGGCDLDGASPDARLGWLGAMLGHVYQRPDGVPVTASPRPEGHRARITLHLEGGRFGYRGARSHTLAPIETCRVARPELQAKLPILAALPPAALAGLTDVELRTDGARTVAVFSGRATGDVAALAPLGDVVVDTRTAHGSGVLTLTVDGLALRVSPRSFFQVNLEANASLAAFVRDSVRAAAPERLLDLYAGVGNLSLPLARDGLPVVAVEAPGSGAEDLRHNAKGLPAEILAVSAEKFDPSRTPFDAVILDPPRAGAPGVLDRVARSRPKVIVYVSCFAPSAARDLAKLGGYVVTEVRGFDLFPDTHHVESVVVARRR